jgi:mitochondrial import inner membrane translocase subunit TIM21
MPIKLQQRMPGTYKFYTSPPLQASERPRHRNRTVPSAIMLDQWGREHLYLNFWIETTAPSQASLTSWAGFDDWEWTMDHISQWTHHQSEILWRKSRSVFAMLVGESPPGSLPSPVPSPPSPPTTQPKERKSSWFALAGLFSSVRSSRVMAETRKADPVIYTAGEVHVDLIRVGASQVTGRGFR